MKFEITKSELGFISDLISGAQTPGALLAIGNFVGHVSNHVLGYQSDLEALANGQKLAMEDLAKEYFEQDEQGQPKIEAVTDPTTGQETQKWVEKAGVDIKKFEELYKSMTDESMKARQDLGMAKIAVVVEDNVFHNFKNALMNDVRIIDAIRAMGLKDEKQHQEFIGVLYNTLVSLDTAVNLEIPTSK